MSEFKPGDVVQHPELGRGIVQGDSLGGPPIVEWGSHGNYSPLVNVEHVLRRLVVIDPDSADDLDRFCKALVEKMHAAGDVASAEWGRLPDDWGSLIDPVLVRDGLASEGVEVES